MTQSNERQLEVTSEDVALLCKMNPLAAEQLKNIALQRRLAELEQMLSRGSGDDGDNNVVPLRATDPEEAQ